MGKIPCIKCTPELWEYIKPYLKEWGYTTDDFSEKFNEQFPILILNWSDRIGYYGFGFIKHLDENRILIDDVEEFLERAAKLKGFTYKRKDIMEINGVKIKPGMVLIGKDWSGRERILVAFPVSYGIAFATVVSEYTTWTSDYTTQIKELREIRDKANGDLIDNGKLLWEKPKEEVVLTMQDIADKFGIPVGQLRIKE